MIIKGSTTQKAAAPPPNPASKDEAKKCLVMADQYIKEAKFEKARIEVERAMKLDPTNPYIVAFQDRIKHFEELNKVSTVPPAPDKQPSPEPPPKPVEQPKHVSASQPAPPPAQAKTPTSPPPTPAPQKTEAAPKPPPPPPKETPPPPKAPEPPPVVTAPPPPPVQVPPPVQKAPAAHDEDKGVVESKLEEMKRQLEELTKALDLEKRAREEIEKRHLQGAVKQLRMAMEKAWVNGAPNEKESDVLRQMAISLSIPEEVLQSLQREVKLDMYSRAVKEVISKRKLLRSSSSTLEWLRKVYQVSVSEYLENESKFLLDLVSDQYRGTVLFVSSSQGGKDLIPRLKSNGYAVVHALSPEIALEKIEKINPNVIVCETQFPDGSLSGVKFLHLLRTNSKFNFLPFVMIAVDGDEKKQFESSELRLNEGCVHQPVDFDELSSMINQKLAAFRDYISSLA